MQELRINEEEDKNIRIKLQREKMFREEMVIRAKNGDKTASSLLWGLYRCKVYTEKELKKYSRKRLKRHTSPKK